MTERSDLLCSIAETIADYREGDLRAPAPEHVFQWVNQFDDDVRLPILREMDHVLRKTYISRKKAKKFMGVVFAAEKLVGDDPCAFWRKTGFLDIQGAGANQKQMLALFSKVLYDKCGFTVADCGADPHSYVYIDDAIFSGGRIRQDLIKWIIEEAPDKTALHVIVLATHQGSWYNRNQIDAALRASNKNISIKYWYAVELEDRKAHTDRSDVLRPVLIPEDLAVRTYTSGLGYPPHLRKAGQVGGLGLFSSDEGRQVLEQEFLKAGVRIREMCPNLNQYQRPLGNMVLKTLGFGSLIVTFRNCPNNTPLALWVGDPWYPLFPRVTNAQTSHMRFMAMLARDER